MRLAMEAERAVLDRMGITIEQATTVRSARWEGRMHIQRTLGRWGTTTKQEAVTRNVGRKGKMQMIFQPGRSIERSGRERGRRPKRTSELQVWGPPRRGR